jgi:hypothetical protein
MNGVKYSFATRGDVPAIQRLLATCHVPTALWKKAVPSSEMIKINRPGTYPNYGMFIP